RTAFAFDSMARTTFNSKEQFSTAFEIANTGVFINNFQRRINFPCSTWTFRTFYFLSKSVSLCIDQRVSRHLTVHSKLILRYVFQCHFTGIVNKTDVAVTAFKTEGFVEPIEILLT